MAHDTQMTLVNLFFQGDVTDCKIKTREVEDCADFNFAKANIIRQQTPPFLNSSFYGLIISAVAVLRL